MQLRHRKTTLTFDTDIKSIFLCNYTTRWLLHFGHTPLDVKTFHPYLQHEKSILRDYKGYNPLFGGEFSSTQWLPLTFLGGGCMLRRVFPAAPGVEEEGQFCSHLPSLTRDSPSMRTHPTHAPSSCTFRAPVRYWSPALLRPPPGVVRPLLIVQPPPPNSACASPGSANDFLSDDLLSLEKRWGGADKGRGLIGSSYGDFSYYS